MIKIFISSTFSDMQSERDIIRAKVFPRLRNELQKNGTDVQFVDLRWGISGESMNPKEIMSKILSVCMDEIEACKPFFVLLLGSRYGTIPDEESVGVFLKKHSLADAVSIRGKSITEIEFMCATGFGDIASQLCVCVRDEKVFDLIPSSVHGIYEDVDRENIDRFRNMAVERFPHSVIYFSAGWDDEKKCLVGLDGLAEDLYNMLLEKTTATLENTASTPEEAALNRDILFIERTARDFVYSRYSDEVDGFIRECRPILSIEGKDGSGKSSLIAKEVSVLDKDRYHMVSLFLGEGVRTLTADEVLHHLLYRLNGDTVDASDGRSVKMLISDSIGRIQNKRVVVFLDNIDILPAEEREKLFSFLPFPCVKIDYTLVISTNGEDIPKSIFRGRQIDRITLEDPDVLQTRELVASQLSKAGKELGPEAMTAFCASALNKSPLYVTLAVKRLTMMSKKDFDAVHRLSVDKNIDGNAALAAYLIKLIEELPQDEEGLIRLLLANACDEYGEGSVDLLVRLVAEGGACLRVSDIRNIMERELSHPLSMLDLVTLSHYLGEILKVDEVSDSISFSYGAFRKEILRKEYDHNKVLRSVFDYLTDLPDTDPVKQRIYFTLCLQLSKPVEALRCLSGKFISHDGFMYFRSLISPSTECLFVKGLNSVVALAEGEKPSVFRAVAENILFGVFSAVNGVFGGKGDMQINILKPLYDSCRHRLSAYPDDIDFLRITYMTAEKCGISCSKYAEREEYFNDLLEFTRLACEKSQDYPHRDYILSDRGHALEKIASLFSNHGQRRAIEFYDEAIATVSADVPASTDIEDLLTFQKYELFALKYRTVNALIRQYIDFGWEYEDLLKKYCRNQTKDLLEAIEFFERAVLDFDKKKRSHVIIDYYRLRADCKEILGMYYGYAGREGEGYRYLKEAVSEHLENYHFYYNPIEYDKIRMVCLYLNDSNYCDREEKIYYVLKANEILLTLINDGLVPADMVKELLDDLNGRLLGCIIRKIHPQIDFDGDDFTATPAAVIDASNYSDILNCCKLYYRETLSSSVASVYSVDDRSDVRLTYMSILMADALRGLISFATRSSVDKIRKGMECIGRMLDIEARKLFETTVSDALKIISVVRDASEKLLAIGMNDICSGVLGYLDIVRKAAHNLWVMALERRGQADEKEADEFSFRICSEYLYFDEFNTVRNGKARAESPKEAELWSNRLCIPTADLRVFAGCIRAGKIEVDKYLGYCEGRFMHWYNAYTEMRKMREPSVLNDMVTIAEYIIANFNDIRVRRLVYNSNFYECLALDHAFGLSDKETSESIVRNGYDHFLEIETLYIIRKFSRRQYDAELLRLKVICLKHIDINAMKNRYMRDFYHELYGDIFCDELSKKVKEQMKNIDTSDMSDVRNRAKRLIPEWV